MSVPPTLPALYHAWFIPNGICEWVPEESTVIVDEEAETITYDAFMFTGSPGRGFGSNIICRSDRNPSVQPEDDETIIYARTVPLHQPPDDRVRALFAKTKLTLVER